ncbi:MAG: AraC family transcriptional regulator, partial [Leeuwenhoekiella sp.]|nr:AraC family transcriptional regulator [Leeuwenhoekiella sp.]
METLKNIATGLYRETTIEEGFFILKFNNETAEKQLVTREVDSSFIQFHFCAKGNSVFQFNEGNY